MPVSANLSVDDGAEVLPVTSSREFREPVKTKDITGGLPRTPTL